MNDQSLNPATNTTHAEPTWFSELAAGLAIRAQFVMTGNVRDLFPVHGKDGIEFADFESAVWRILDREGCAALLIHDPVRGLRLHEDCDPALSDVMEQCGIPLGTVAATPDEIQTLAERVMSEMRVPMALIFDYASPQLRQADTDRLFVAMDQSTRRTPGERPGVDWKCPARNPVFWMVERGGDLPSWFATANPAVRELVIGMPDLGDRSVFVTERSAALHDFAALEATDRDLKIEQFAVRCEGMTLTDIEGVLGLARAQKMGLGELGEALRSYRLGTTRNPWTSPVMKSRVRNAKSVLEHRVKGQPRALEKTYDILVRSIMGLSGAQTTNRGTRPRGTLFFVGPTGTGKTELAKAVAEVMFGDETAMNRFDMSEFMNEDSIGRLVGPPPGAVGHENGGELVNAVRARPFSVFLFDEIEKGHPRILDAFLQILDDGRLSDSRGETGYFSEALIIFTSNIGMVGGDRAANGGQRVLPSDGPDAIEEKLTRAVADHFRYELKRPELFNRFGQNIVPFEFINTQSAKVIFEAVYRRVVKAVFEEHGVRIKLTDKARMQLMQLCTFELNDGGRGIGNRMESAFVNPLARLLFRYPEADRLLIGGFDTSGRETKLVLERPQAKPAA